jgi:hypothetical protein
VSSAYVGPAATVIPLVELTVAAVLLAGLWPREAAIAAIALLVLFTGVLGRMWASGATLDCGCFGESSEASTPATGVVRNAALITAALLVVISPDSARLWAASVGTVAAATTVAAGAICLWLCVSALVIRRQLLFYRLGNR